MGAPAAAGGMAKGAGYVQAGVQVASGLAKIYGTYQGAKMAEKSYKLAVDEFEEAKRRAKEQDVLAKQQIQLGNITTLGGYAQGQQQNVLDQYGQYNRMIGR